jgi:hypothetical protein
MAGERSALELAIPLQQRTYRNRNGRRRVAFACG